MATPNLWCGVIKDGKTSKITKRKMIFYLPILKEKVCQNKPIYMKYEDLTPDLREIFLNVNYENYYELWTALKKYSKNDLAAYLRVIGKIMKTQQCF
jgi:hypothetical protein